MTKREQQRLDRQLENIADNLLIKGWSDCRSIADDYYLRMLEILNERITKDIERLKNNKNKE